VNAAGFLLMISVNEIFRNHGSFGKLFSLRVLIFGTEFLPKQLTLGKMTITTLAHEILDKTRQSSHQ
jgi:hypothetical protein